MFEAAQVREKLLPRAAFRPFPVYEDRRGWQALPANVRADLLAEGEKYRGYGWPTTLASLYLDYYRNGNRTRYEHVMNDERRIPLIALALAECCEGEGRFIDDILNGVWVLLEETCWVAPAHNSQFAKTGALPRALPDAVHPENQYIDLSASRTGNMVAWLWYTLGERLGQEAPQVPERMLYELERRIYKPFLENTGFMWMGYDGRSVNNWNPYIVSNLLTCATLACPNEDERAAVVEKCLECLEFFVRGYAPDGGCDEGPGYWNMAGAALFDCLDILRDATGGQADYLQAPLVRNICSYIYKMHIAGRSFVNYADANALLSPDAVLLYRMGETLGDEHLVRMGAAFYADQLADGTAHSPGTSLYRGMKKLLALERMEAHAGGEAPLVRDVWFEGIQVMAARQAQGSSEGLYLSAKGGNNGESHNHNDVGSFVVYCDGKPVIVDIGSGQYEKKTFSPQRYEIPQLRSLYHNLPIVGGKEQPAGREFAAQDVEYGCEGDTVRFGMELRGAYPADAGIKSWRRTFAFDRSAGTVTVDDAFDFDRAEDVQLVLITTRAPQAEGDALTFTVDDGTAVRVRHAAAGVSTQAFETGKDPRLASIWGERLYRTVFALGTLQSGSHRFQIQKL